MIDDEAVMRHRRRGLNPDHPVVRGTAQNPDVYFQGRETVNPYYAQTPGIVQTEMDRFAALTGRAYRLFEYAGAPDAERVILLMGSGAQTAMETCRFLMEKGEKVGVVQVHLYRPFSMRHLIEALPKTVQKLAVLDRCKEPGAGGEPLYQDVVTALVEARNEGLINNMPVVTGGRYGLSSKEFTPGMVRGIFDELKKEQPKNHFTIGIYDDVSGSSLPYHEFELHDPTMTQALFFALGSDGTVGANKNSIKIIGENTDLYAEGYFVYDSKKSGSQSVSHLRFGKNPIHTPYLIREANFIACHKFNFVQKVDMLGYAKPGSTFCSTALRQGRDGTNCQAPCNPPFWKKTSVFTSSTLRKWRRRWAWAAASTPSCRSAFLPSRAFCPKTRPSSRSKKPLKRPTAKKARTW